MRATRWRTRCKARLNAPHALVHAHDERCRLICRRRLQSELEMEPPVALLEAYQRAKLALSPGVSV